MSDHSLLRQGVTMGLAATLVLTVTALPMAALTADERDAIARICFAVPDDEMYGEVLEVVLEALDSKHGTFGYINADGAFVVPSLTTEVWEQCQVPGKTFVFPRESWGDSSWPTAIRQKRAVVLNETSTLTPAGHIPIRRHISLPILFRGETIGLFQVANRDTDYTDADVQQLQSIADYIAPLLAARLERDAAVIEEVRAEGRAEVLDANQKRLMAIAGLALSVAVLVCSVLIRIGRTQQTIKQNTDGIEATRGDVNTLRDEAHACRTRLHERIDETNEKVGVVQVTAASIEAKVDVLLEHNGCDKPDAAKE